MLKRARTSAKNALEYENEIRKQLDEVVIEDGNSTRKLSEADKEKFFDELYEVAEKTRNAGKYTIQNEGVITITKFNKIAKRIKKEYGVDMFLVDRNNEQWSELFKRWQKEPLDGMWVDQPLNSKNYPGIKLDGPALYLFKGSTSRGIYEVTSYTVQHELFHFKMWNRLKELYPKNYLTKFHEIPDEIHETFVLSEFVKAKKYTKWSDQDILADLKAFNENFARNMKLEDFEKFDLEIYLKNLK